MPLARATHHRGTARSPHQAGQPQGDSGKGIIGLLQARAVDDPQAAANAMTLKEELQEVGWLPPSVPWGTAIDQVYV
jgi:hypothetical protein